MRDDALAGPPFVSVVIPTLDEAAHIERCLASLLDDPYPRDRLEVLVVDGGSLDGTRDIVRRLAARWPLVQLVDNPERLQSAAVNRALARLDPRASLVLRCDAHARYPSGFISRAAGVMAETGADLAAFADRPETSGCFQRAVAFAQSTRVGVGNAWYRLGTVSRWVDHGKHGCFRRALLEQVGGYDAAFSHNEDSELSIRLAQAGGRIWLDTALSVGYHPRATVRALARQYWLYGRGRAATVLKHRIRPAPRQMAPVALVLLNGAAVLAAPVQPWTLALPALYLASLAAVAAVGAARQRSACILAAPLALAAMHHAWGAGFLARILGKAPRTRGVGHARDEAPAPRSAPPASPAPALREGVAWSEYFASDL